MKDESQEYCIDTLKACYTKEPGSAHPAPFVDVVITDVYGRWESVPFKARVDTGADISCIPSSVLDSVLTELDRCLLARKPKLIRSHSGSCTRERTVLGDLSILTNDGNVFWRGRLRDGFLITKSAIGLLGMDVLSHLRVSLRGSEVELALETSVGGEV